MKYFYQNLSCSPTTNSWLISIHQLIAENKVILFSVKNTTLLTLHCELVNTGNILDKHNVQTRELSVQIIFCCKTCPLPTPDVSYQQKGRPDLPVHLSRYLSGGKTSHITDKVHIRQGQQGAELRRSESVLMRSSAWNFYSCHVPMFQLRQVVFVDKK